MPFYRNGQYYTIGMSPASRKCLRNRNRNLTYPKASVNFMEVVIILHIVEKPLTGGGRDKLFSV
jgi:hypothetical protein